MPHVLLAMSGGVDSSVAAHLLLEQGHDVTGVYLHHGPCRATARERDDRSGPAEGDLRTEESAARGSVDAESAMTGSADADARQVADRLGIPFHAIDLEVEFNQIIDYFVADYISGRTPNPCIVCNQRIKFGKLFDYADDMGASLVATGHYARIEHSADRMPTLRRGVDLAKDQSYVLFGIDRKLLSRIRFPIGELTKESVRRMAADLDLGVADKPESQEICFITEGNYSAFIAARRPHRDTSGDIITTDGTVVGHHDGMEGFTVGQRKGLGVALGQPRYVVRIEAKTRRVVLGKRHELARTTLMASAANWHWDAPIQPRACLAQVRYTAPAVGAMVTPLADTRFRIDFDQPQMGIAPGQAVVCYDGDRVLGGGWID